MTKDWMKASVSLCVVAIACLAFASLPGCADSGQFGTAPVKGTVTHDGKPVEGGSLTFTPSGGEGGKPAAADVQSDGTYAAGTYDRADGAVVGKHTVSYSPPVVEFPEDADVQPGDERPPSPYDGLVPKTTEVEVTAGENQIDIELVAPGGAPSPEPSPEPTE